jgi:hypothetical protein
VRQLQEKVLPALVDTYYPNPIGPNYCRDIELNRGELAFVRDVFAGRLNELIRSAAARAQVRVIDLEHALDGHRICDVPLSLAAVNFIALGRTRGTTVDLSVKGIIGLAHGTLHPNVRGHQLMHTEVRRRAASCRSP